MNIAKYTKKKVSKKGETHIYLTMQKKLKIKSGKKNLENLYFLCTVDAFLGTFYSKMKPFIKRQKKFRPKMYTPCGGTKKRYY
jgi:hypothetical protein